MKLLYHAYQLIIAAPLLLVATTLTALTTSAGCLLGNAHFWGYYPGKLWSRLMCRLLLIPVRVEGREHIDHRTSYVFVANHQGQMDIFLIYGYLGRNFKWMMKKALRRIPLVGYACEKAGFVFVDKSGPKKIQETYDQARHVLQDGTSLVVFPEGARTYTGRMAPFRKGAFQLAAELQLPIVPLTIDGSFEVLNRTEGFTFVHRHPMRLVVHPPIAPSPRGDHDALRRVMDEARRAIMADLPPRHQDPAPAGATAESAPPAGQP